ncbi:conserved protein of unknown function [Paraburkholderia dioscoreae]|uniref:Uncharacterized protein n=1 Tax=Paraburkholderia dioscoreae TaxID=2604047 RepID=A0A5Q4Z8Q4_9BURK|nr:conserved protein of unknown function [Paraburkholderia dioscoreae]
MSSQKVLGLARGCNTLLLRRFSATEDLRERPENACFQDLSEITDEALRMTNHRPVFTWIVKSAWTKQMTSPILKTAGNAVQVFRKVSLQCTILINRFGK